MEINITPVEEAQKSVLRQLIEFYHYDFSEYDQKDINEFGYFGYKYLDYYWTEEGRNPFFIQVDGTVAGFVLVNEYCYLVKVKGAKSIAEFFVMRKYRRLGIGKTAAFIIFNMYPSHWEVLQHENNLPSIQFWERVVDEYTGGKFQKKLVKTEDWEGQALLFNNSS